MCVQDCYQDKRYHPGDEVTGKTCPPYFVVKPSKKDKDE